MCVYMCVRLRLCVCVNSFVCARVSVCKNAHIYIYMYVYKCMYIDIFICMQLYSAIAITDTATHCNTLHHTATHCNTLQHAATRWAQTTLQHPGSQCLSEKHLPFVRYVLQCVDMCCSVLTCVAVR